MLWFSATSGCFRNHLGQNVDGCGFLLSGHKIAERRFWAIKWRGVRFHWFPKSLIGQIRRGRDGRVAEGARLESVYTGNRIVGSNPTLSASILLITK